MANPIYLLIGCFGLVVSSITLVRTRGVLRFRSPGRIEPGSIPDWKVWVWRGMAGVMMAMSGILIAIVVFQS